MSCAMQSMVSTFGCVGDGQTLLANERAPSALHSHGVGLQTASVKYLEVYPCIKGVFHNISTTL